jgi:hypothetical protein
MQIKIDGQPFTLPSKVSQFQEALDQVVRACGKDGRVVSRLLINGEEHPAWGASQTAAVGIEDVQTLEVETSASRAIALEVLNGCAAHTPPLIENLSLCARLLRTGQTQEAMSGIDGSLVLWLQLIAGTESALKALGMRWDDVSAVTEEEDSGGVTASQLVLNINDLLEETRRVMEKQDWVELADILDYDMPPQLRAFQKTLEKLAESSEK